MWFRTSLLASALLIIAAMPPSHALAATATVKDGATLQLAGNTFRLDGVDAPVVDQMCIDDHADSWACGVEARLVVDSKIGRERVYAVNPVPLQSVAGWLEGYRSFWQASLTRLKRNLEAK